ncbi:FadR/GntR family transcriptional regulator [Protaetiibacter mangrovi]|uniref:GntR family transcriptional regulator n=1 Tax=Protaetiibacter mangrovi TaxID=2970926 RepID=A0ABT1ZHM7_9MICO|nr:GntR family transcriptional regulator [Protaetiibacter mangrovi]MCS0500219.1 GntR family transcriptional regulator [Protaetiibacter mangrovi]TPW98994.1 FadR family transcriptional regulator [Schumannella luteola]
MPRSTGHRDATRSVVFAPLDDGAGRAELVERRIGDAIVGGLLRDGERLPSEAELSRSLGVALVTAREALESLRDHGLVRTRRGRDGGSFVTYDREAAARTLQARLQGHSRIELRDLAVHLSAIAGTAAELAADRASDDDLESLVAIHHDADLRTEGGARRALLRFQLEVAAISQSPRLVREEVRLQAEAGPLVWLCLREAEYRERTAVARTEVIAAIREVAPAAARSAVLSLIDDATGWLIDEKLRLETGDPA